jgi:hypothetical protein
MPKPRNRKKLPPRPRPAKRKQPRQTAPRKSKSSGNRGGVAQSIGQALGQGLGNYVMPGVGGSVGGTLGSGLGWAFKKVTGYGDYKIMANTLTMSGSPVPAFGENCIRIRHKEYLGDVLSTTAFTLTSIALNPGLSLSFPWLCTVASNYQEYYFAGLLFSFVSTSADALNSTNTALGKIIMATDYNASDTVFINPQQMLATEFSNYGKPADNLLHAVECHPGTRPTKWQYVRTAAVGTGRDPRLYDLGVFQIASQGMQAAANIGGLWVSYDIILCKPVIAASGSVMDYWYSSTCSTNSSIAPASVSGAVRSIGCTITGTTVAPQLNFPFGTISGTYRVTTWTDGLNHASTFQTTFAGLFNNQINTAYDPLLSGTYTSNAASGQVTFMCSGDYQIYGTGSYITLQTPLVTAATTASIALEVVYLGP